MILRRLTGSENIQILLTNLTKGGGGGKNAPSLKSATHNM